MEASVVTLAELVDHLAEADGERDRTFVRRLSEWLQTHAPHLSLDAVERAGLTDVALTLQMREEVVLVVTGRNPDAPGEWSWRVREHEFPDVHVRLHREPVAAPYLHCTLDYGVAGLPLRLADGRRGFAVVAATVGLQEEWRVRLAGGEVVTVPAGQAEVG